MDIGKSFSFPFEDEQWLEKSLIGALVAAIPIVNFAWGGYLIDLLKNVMRGQDVPLPEWGDFGDKWMKGLYLSLASFVYAIPIFLLSCILVATFSGAAYQQGEELTDQLIALLTGVGGILGCLIALYALALSFFFPAAYIHYARVGTFGAFFEIGKIFKIVTADTGKYITAWLVSMVAGIVVSSAVALLTTALGFIPCLGWALGILVSAVSGVYVFYVYGHLFGQVGAPQTQALIPQ